jgi:prephenate dehydrogenase
MWTEILLDNREAIATGVGELRRALDAIERLLAAGDRAGIEALLARIKAQRESLA